MEAAISATENFLGNVLVSDNKYPILFLAKTLSCHVLYEEWLKLMEEMYRNEGRNMILSIQRVRQKSEDFQRTLIRSIYQPPLCAVHSTLDSYEGARNGGEISFERFKRGVIAHDAVAAELNMLANYPSIV